MQVDIPYVEVATISKRLEKGRLEKDRLVNIDLLFYCILADYYTHRQIQCGGKDRGLWKNNRKIHS